MTDSVARCQVYQCTPAQANRIANRCGSFKCGILAPWVWFCWHYFRSFLFIRITALCWGWPACLVQFFLFCLSFHACSVLFFLLFVVLPVASPPREGTRQRFYSVGPGQFFLPFIGILFSFFFYSFAFFPAYLFAYFEVITLSLSPCVFPFPFLHVYVVTLQFSLFFILYFCVSFLFQCIGVAGVCLCLSQPRTSARHCTAAVYLVQRSCLCRSFVSLNLSRMKTQRGHWVCWMSTSRENGLM